MNVSNTTWDVGLFEALNFDGGEFMDWFMTTVSGVAMWIPLYLLIIYMVWRRYSWFGVAAFIVAVSAAMGLADIIAGIFKHSGPLGSLWSDFPVRLRPMFTESLVDVHVVSAAHGAYGTVSAHAATIVTLALMCSYLIKHRWFTVMMVLFTLLICYSRIYLACHFPQDILIGALLGLITGVVGLYLFRWLMRLQVHTRK